MISLDQVYLLEQKVESAVAKIQQLQAENDALRNKCAELTNALSAKSEQLTTIETDQTQIENGIKKALDRLNSIENSVLKTVSSMNVSGQAASPTPVKEAPSFATMSVMPQTPATSQAQAVVQEKPVQTNPNSISNSKPIVQTAVFNESPDDSNSVVQTAIFNESPDDSIPENDQTPFSESIQENDDNEEDELGFDIF